MISHPKLHGGRRPSKADSCLFFVNKFLIDELEKITTLNADINFICYYVVLVATVDLFQKL